MRLYESPRSTDGGNTFGKPRKPGEGTWKINACTMDGGDLTHVAGKTISAWRRMEDIYIAEPGKPEQKIEPGHDVTAAGAGGKLYLLYIREGKASSGAKTTRGKSEKTPPSPP